MTRYDVTADRTLTASVARFGAALTLALALAATPFVRAEQPQSAATRDLSSVLRCARTPKRQLRGSPAFRRSSIRSKTCLNRPAISR